MPEKSAYETGARKYPARTGPDPSDDFSQDAAGNRPPADKEKSKDTRKPENKEVSPEPDHQQPTPRDVRDAPSPNPNGKRRS